jgi:hypothetical protein
VHLTGDGGKMKLTKRQLRKLISEVAIELSDEEVAAAKQKLKDEGGAAGPQMVAQAVKDAEDGDPDVADEDVLDALMTADEDIKLHSSGDVIDVGGLAEGIFVGDDDGTVLSPKDVDDFEYSGQVKDDEALGKHPKLDPLLKSTDLPTKKHGRSLAVTLGYQDDLTPYEELAVDHIDDKLILSPDTPIEHPPLRNKKAHRIQLELTKEFEQFLNSPKGAELARSAVERAIMVTPNRLPLPIEIPWTNKLIRGYKEGDFNLSKRLYRKLGLDADDGYIVDPETRAMFRALHYHLLLKLNEIAVKRFDTNYIKVVKGQIHGSGKFPLALTEAELKQMIMEELAERKKRKKKKKKKTKSKKRGYLYPYAYGSHYDHLDHVDYGDYGTDGTSFDGGGDGGGGE